MLSLDEYLKLRNRPSGKPVMFQSWRDLSFLHFSVPPDEIQALLPAGLEVDVFEGSAYVGLVPFRMQDIRLRGLPPVPGTAAFPETNVRTYVHHNGKEPGVWFFSLDASSELACRVARRFFRLPYHHAEMRCERVGGSIEYRSSRIATESVGVDAYIAIGEPVQTPEPGSLEFFLVERYLLYASSDKSLFKGQVSHVPYPLRAASILHCRQSLIEAVGITSKPWVHQVFSDGVDVEVFGLEAV